MSKHIPEGGIRCLKDAEQFLLATSSKRNSVSKLMKCLEDSPKPWTTKYWKDERRRVIGNRCNSCNTEKGPMVLQHKWHRLSLWDATTLATIHLAKKDGKDIELERWYGSARDSARVLAGRIRKDNEWHDRKKNDIDRLALKIVAEEAVKYWSMLLTTTECKRCAFLWDKRPDMLLREKETEEERLAFVKTHPSLVNGKRMLNGLLDFPLGDLW
jgi:hypothetical protein